VSAALIGMIAEPPSDAPVDPTWSGSDRSKTPPSTTT
jgi:hypothetical protein